MERFLKVLIACAVFGWLWASVLLALPLAALAGMLVGAFLDHSFYSVLKVAWPVFGILIAVGIVLSESRGRSSRKRRNALRGKGKAPDVPQLQPKDAPPLE